MVEKTGCEMTTSTFTEDDPRSILRMACDERRTGQFQQALEKHIWYHHHALCTGSGENRVRLSFALMYWRKLADQYPPAMEELNSLKTRARAKVISGDDPIGSIREYLAICRHLEHQPESRDLFWEIHRTRPELARRVFPYVMPILIEAGDFKICDLYLEPDSQVDRIIKRYRDSQSTETELSVRFRSREREKFKIDASAIVALLKFNGHQRESQRIADRIRAAWDDHETMAELEEALNQGFAPTDTGRGSGDN